MMPNFRSTKDVVTQGDPEALVATLLNIHRAVADGNFPNNHVKDPIVDIRHTPYPVTEDSTDQRRVHTPILQGDSLSVAFTLGFYAGSINDPERAAGYECLLRTLGALHQVGLTYGLIDTKGVHPSSQQRLYFVAQVKEGMDVHLHIEVPIGDASLKL